LKIRKEYLMSEQEINQDNIIETIFKKFDADNSGGLDLEEMVDLFKDNNVYLKQSTLKEMFQSDEFTLDGFKALINS